MRGSRPQQLLVLLLLVAFSLTVLDSRGSGDGPLGALRRGSDTVFGPAQRAVGGLVNNASDAVGGLGNGDTGELQRQNDELRRRVIELEGDAALGQQAKALLRLKDQGSYTTVLARVVGYGAFQPFESTVTIDAGSDDGLAVDMTVANGSGLVGKVVRVGPRTSSVSVLTDPVFSAGVNLNTAAGSFGFATGDGRGGLTLRLTSESSGAQLTAGGALVTSGEGTLAAGLPVGRITTVDSGAGGQARTATLAPYADAGALDLVQVIVDGPRTEPRVAIPPAPAPTPTPAR